MKLVAAVSLASALAACGDNIVLDDTPVPPAQTLVIVAHFDDDEIFMQPELDDAIAAGSITTVYVTSGDPLHAKGVEDQLRVYNAAMIAYGETADASDWQCGYTMVTGLPARHCRLPDRGVSLLALDVPDGGITGIDNRYSLLNLLDGSVAALPILSEIGGYTVTRDQIVDELAAIITATAPTQIHTLDVGGTHGYDNSSHILAGGFALWAAARAGYAGDLRAHRGYNIASNAPTFFAGPDYERAAYMLGFFDACYFHCGPCGDSCVYPDASHLAWLQREYSTDRALTATGQLALADASACATESGGGLALGSCAAASTVTLDPTGHLEVAGGCIAAGADGTVAIAACSDDPSQYWLLDGEGNLWSGQPVTSSQLTTYDNARCLSPQANVLAAPICGLDLQTHWQLVGL